MKTLLLVRHAKSSWADPGQEDRERPLNERGKKDAPAMAKRTKEKGIKIDAFVTSPAKRAKRTARCFAEEYGLEKDELVLAEELYGASPEVFYKVITELPEKYKTVAFFSHNPGITEFVNTLTDVHVDNMPTSAVYAVSADTDEWRNFKECVKCFLFFDYPKNPLGK